MYKRLLTAALAATMLWSLTGCDNTAPDNPTQESEQTSTEETDTTGEVGVYIRPNLTPGVGIDMGGGLNYNINSGAIEFSPYGF